MMKKLARHSGTILMAAGTTMLAAMLLTGFTAINGLLLAALLMVVGGAVLHVYLLKRESAY